MSRHTKIILIALAGLILLGVLLYQIPTIQNRLDWRLEIAKTYIHGIFYPVGALPTPLPVTPEPVTPTTAQPQTVNGQPTPTLALPPTPTVPPFPTQVSLPTTAWEHEDMNNCGPATLTMALHMYAWVGDQFDISKVIKPVRADRNVNPDELVWWVRNYAGWLRAEYRVNGDLTLLRRLMAAGFPVIVETTFKLDPSDSGRPNDDLWAAHYLLLTGYDDTAQTVIGQDPYHGPDQIIPYTTLEESWRPFNHVYLLIYLPDQEGQLRDILGSDWDVDANRRNALNATQAETVSHLEDAFAWFNYGSNLVYFEQYNEAARAYDTARTLGTLPQRMLRYQFGPFFAYFNSGRIDDLLALTKYALEITDKSEEAWLWQGWGLYRKGDLTGAVRAWQRALEIRPGYPDAQSAIDFLKSTP